ncbi:MAG: hypothetical protein R3E96_04110 [Planctomycetota bacterium]
MFALLPVLADTAFLDVQVGLDAVQQGRLASAGRAVEDRDLVLHQRREFVESASIGGAGVQHTDRDRLIGLRDRLDLAFGGQVDLVEHQHRFDLVPEARGQDAIGPVRGKARPRKRADQEKLVYVGHQHLLARVMGGGDAAQVVAPFEHAFYRQGIAIGAELDEIANRDRVLLLAPLAKKRTTGGSLHGFSVQVHVNDLGVHLQHSSDSGGHGHGQDSPDRGRGQCADLEFESDMADANFRAGLCRRPRKNL